MILVIVILLVVVGEITVRTVFAGLGKMSKVSLAGRPVMPVAQL